MVLKSDQGGLADVVFNPFGITFGCRLVDPETLQKRDDEPVSPAASRRERLAPLGEENRTIFFTSDQPCVFQPGDILGHSWGLDSQPSRNVDRSRLAVRFDQFGDQFHIVFRHLAFMRIAHVDEPVSLGFGVS